MKKVEIGQHYCQGEGCGKPIPVCDDFFYKHHCQSCYHKFGIKGPIDKLVNA
jgi:hypothetical protein